MQLQIHASKIFISAWNGSECLFWQYEDTGTRTVFWRSNPMLSQLSLYANLTNILLSLTLFSQMFMHSLFNSLKCKWNDAHLNIVRNRLLCVYAIHKRRHSFIAAFFYFWYNYRFKRLENVQWTVKEKICITMSFGCVFVPVFFSSGGGHSLRACEWMAPKMWFVTPVGLQARIMVR